MSRTPAHAVVLSPRHQWIRSLILERFDGVTESDATRLVEGSASSSRPSVASEAARAADSKRVDTGTLVPEEPPSISSLLAGTGRASVFVHYQQRAPSSTDVRAGLLRRVLCFRSRSCLYFHRMRHLLDLLYCFYRMVAVTSCSASACTWCGLVTGLLTCR